MLNKTTFIGILFVLLLGHTQASSQCKVDSSQLHEIQNLFKKLKISKADGCNFQFQISTLPDVDWMTLPKQACISKSQVLAIIDLYFKTCQKANIEDIDHQLIENLKIILDEDNYLLEVAFEESDAQIVKLNCYIRNSRMGIFINKNHLIGTQKYKGHQDSIKYLKSVEWDQIEDVLNRFDTSSKYRCGYLFAMGAFPNGYLPETEMKVITGVISRDQLFNLFKYYNQLCTNHEHMILDAYLIQKLKSIPDDDFFNAKILYSQDQNKVNEIRLYIKNTNKYFQLDFYQARNEAGEIIK